MWSVFLDVILVVSWVLLGFTICKIFFFVSMSSRHHRQHLRQHPAKLTKKPLVSILVPGYNESKTLANCIDSLVTQTYPKTEILFINDGSSDDTLTVARRLQKQYKQLRVLDSKHGGKAKALNKGIAAAKGEIVVCIDADSIFMPDTVKQLVLTFQNPEVAAVGGNVKVANRNRLLSRQQALEYITGLTLQRRTFAHLGCMQVISGAIGAFRRDVLREIGGYPSDTVVEDMDVTIELSKRGYKVAYNPQAIAFTEAPETLKDFLKQRYRWTYGGFQVLAKHRKAIWRREANQIGRIGMPYFLIFPWVDVFVSLLFVFTIGRIIFTGQDYALLVVYAAMCVVQALLIVYALRMDKEDKRLVALALLDTMVYYHLLNYTTLRAGVNYLRKKHTTWNKLQRYGRNVLPASAEAGKG